ncbi:MAG: hypothetical protein PVI92_16890, partial [Chromatiales bacterium]
MKFIKLGLILFLLAGSVSAATNRPDGFKTICKIGQTCSVDSSTNVAFGASDRFVYKVLSGSFVCNVDTFGTDPIPWKKVKECSISKTVSSIESSDESSDESSADASQEPTVSLKAEGGDGKVYLTWDVSGTLTKVQVMRDTDSNSSGRDRLASVSVGAGSFTDEDVVNGTQYWYWIKYTYGDGVVGNSESATATPTASDTESTTEPTPTV